MSKFKDQHWNFRIGAAKYNNENTFTVIRVYYKDNKPNSYSHLNGELDNWQSLKIIKKNLKRIKKALKKDIIDLDNWPHKWKDK